MLRINWRTIKAFLRKGKTKRFPFSVNVEPTNHCNLRCPICPHHSDHIFDINTSKREKGYMSLYTYKRVLEASHPVIRFIALYLHGEPFLHPQLPDMVRLTKEKGLKVILSSNGIAITEDMLVKVIEGEPRSLNISMDLISHVGYQQLKGNDRFEDAATKLKMIASVFVDTKTKTRLILRSIYQGESPDVLFDFLDKWLNVPGLSEIQLANLFPWPNSFDADILANRLARKDSICQQVKNAFNILWDGTVTPCGFDFNGEYIVGNIFDSSLVEIINSPKACFFRRMHTYGRRREIKLCADCLLPRFSINVIKVLKNKYFKADESTRLDLFNQIRSLYFSPSVDFQTTDRSPMQA